MQGDCAISTLTWSLVESLVATRSSPCSVMQLSFAVSTPVETPPMITTSMTAVGSVVKFPVNTIVPPPRSQLVGEQAAQVGEGEIEHTSGLDVGEGVGMQGSTDMDQRSLKRRS